MGDRREGWLILADIGGYTKFLSGTELEHAHDILQDLLRVLVDGARPPLKLVKLEGDAVFAYADGDAMPDGRAVLTRLEDTYHAFRMRLFNLERSTTCTCNACRAAPSLELKFALHWGEYIPFELNGIKDLQGAEVVVVHRMLKNEVVEKTGRKAYIFATDAARARIPGAAWIPHREAYEHLGEVAGGVRCLATAFEELTERAVADVRSDEADFVTTYEVAAAPAVVWDWHLDSDKAVTWQTGMTEWTILSGDQGRPLPGTGVHCAHGDDHQSITIRAWRPTHSVTYDTPAHGPMPAIRLTMAFEPMGDGDRTLVHFIVKLTDRSWWDRIRLGLMGLMFSRIFRKDAARLDELLAAARAAAG